MDVELSLFVVNPGSIGCFLKFLTDEPLLLDP
jgi:hypothetical protein